MSELDKHYRKDGEEHQRRAIRLKMNWYQGNITKYAERAPHKGVQNDDLVKVLDYTTMWLESPDKETNPVSLNEDQRNKVHLIANRLLDLLGTTRISAGMGAVMAGEVDYADNRRQVGVVAAGQGEITSRPAARTIKEWKREYGRMPTAMEVAMNNLRSHPYDGQEEGSTPD